MTNTTKFPTIQYLFIVCFLVNAMTLGSDAETIVDFESFPLDNFGFFNGPTSNVINETREYWYGSQEEQVGTFAVDGTDFSNARFGTSWSGFSVSNQINTTTGGPGNQYSVFAGSGAQGSQNFGVASGYRDLQTTEFITEEFIFDPSNLDQLRQLPSIYLPDNNVATSVMVANTTYAALSMSTGDSFAKQFGGPSGNDEDFLRLSVFGIDENDAALSSSIEFFLADFRFTNNNQDFILNTWATLDLTSLSGARSLHFNLDSTDNGGSGMNTPAYFAVDNLRLTAVPEPNLLSVISSLAIATWLRRRRAC